MTYYIGDVHGKYERYKKIIKPLKNTIQVGDMGVGFFRRDGAAAPNPPYDYMVEGDHRFIRGNHDNPAVCKQHTQYIRDGFIEHDTMFIGGGLSIDRMFRVENFSWWRNEELSSRELSELVDKYEHHKPTIMVTHDCPQEVADWIVGTGGGLNGKIDDPSRTRQAFQVMFQIHQPKLWVFGHWHCSRDQEIHGTRFVCLNELECRDLEP